MSIKLKINWLKASKLEALNTTDKPAKLRRCNNSNYGPWPFLVSKRNVWPSFGEIATGQPLKV